MALCNKRGSKRSLTAAAAAECNGFKLTFNVNLNVINKSNFAPADAQHTAQTDSSGSVWERKGEATLKGP